MRDWVAWHEQYEQPGSPLRVRLEIVSSHLSAALTGAPRGRISLVSLCAGQALDVLGVLPEHPRRSDVHAVLVESNPHNAAVARQRAAAAGLAAVEVREADASMPSAYADALPADVLLLCGIFGNVSNDDIRRTATAAAALGRPDCTVIWTRHRRAPDLTPQIRGWFADAGFDELAFEGPQTETMTGVGVHRLRQPAAGPLPGGPLFTFR
ncbi:MAG TPA: SAM-dependent methyltransferase [Streptosporangiaceae bacterium]|nr:SAM-dependent methyltransferase [Streptosporangiaceae bacterium]